MTIKPYFPQAGQVLSHLVDTQTRRKHVCLKDNGIYKEAPKSDMDVDLFDIWPFIENPNVKIGENGLILLEAEAYKPDSVLIKITDRLLEHLPRPRIESIRFALVTAAFPSQKFPNVRELRGVFILHLLEPPYVADVRDGVLIVWPEDCNGKDFRSKVIYHRQPLSAPKPEQTPKPQKYPRPYVVPDPEPEKLRLKNERKELKDFLKFASGKVGKSKCLIRLKVMHEEKRTGDITKDPFYTWNKPYHLWYYCLGNKLLCQSTGCSPRTVVKDLDRLCKLHFIEWRHEGKKGKGNSIFELIKNRKHYELVKRKKSMQGIPRGKAKTGRKPKKGVKGPESGA